MKRFVNSVGKSIEKRKITTGHVELIKASGVM